MRAYRRLVRRPLAPLLAALLLCAALGMPAPPIRAAGATYTVTSLGDTGAGSGLTGDLRYALTQIIAGPGGDTIRFAVTGTIALTSALPTIIKDMTIVGPGADRLAVSGNGVARVFDISPVAGQGYHTVAISGLTITGGRAVAPDGDGAGIRTSFLANLTLTDCVVAGNIAAGLGGGIAIGYGGTHTLERTVVRGNTAAGGGGISVNRDGNIRLHASMVADNVAGEGSGEVYYNGYGGGILSGGGVTLEASTASGNVAGRHANGQGGGVAIVSFHGGLAIADSTISGNTAGGAGGGGQGGGIYTEFGVLITNSTIAGNTAGTGGTGGQGGGIYTDGFPTSYPLLRNVTIARNTATDAGGGVYSKPTDPAGANYATDAANSILADDTAPVAADLSGMFISQGYNLIGDPQGATGFAPTDLVGVHPLLGPLGDNGGPTRTLALLPGSPAINAVPAVGADCPAADQRGVARPQGPACDIGAFEAVIPLPPTGLHVSGATTSGVSFAWADPDASSAIALGIGTARGATYTGLAPGTSSFTKAVAAGYWACAQVAAYNVASASAFTPWVCGLAVPAAPTGIHVTGHTPTSVSFGWTDSDPFSGIAVSNGIAVTMVAPGATAYTQSGMAAGAWVCVSLAAYNASGVSPWTAATPTGWVCGRAG